ncbi:MULTISPECIES: 3'-5' exonuclease [Citrobacter freundii complex]|uniref:exonuclease n=1 Tax=Citrobacter freundii complex TaxID=1344959 RepID=UPI000FEB76AE|nr:MULTISPECIES: exonuclease [Citrobacter freundii complex]MBA7789165.1 3'-5' exoribonuclease [Citrobacter freundii]MBE0095817.1 exonuclease [Citrobacter freundii]MDV0512474.1 3'-5' exoribonuclease [Citrobacter portucalensis]MDV0516997.1 3'-5' exoribonuclease [Citrobacter portucalensis]MDV0562512.1 3'-5' exoribonuclease [Citrobacter portucalensis]
MLTYAYLIKAKAKATEAKNLFCWFSAKSDSRAEREILNILEDNDIAVGRGADYQLPVRTNWFVVDDLPEESTLDDTWCDRYELAEDQQTWQLKQRTDDENQETSSQQKPETSSANVLTSDAPALLRPISRLRLSQRLIAHLLNDGEEKEISEARHIQIGQMELDENDLYVQNLLQAVSNVPAVKELSAHVEWKLTSAVKEVFDREQVYTVASFEQFISEWIEEPEKRALTVQEWVNDKKARIVGDEPTVPPVTPELITVATLPLRQRLLAQFISDEYAYHIDTEQKKTIQELELDVDNSYVQNLLLAAENVEPFRKAPEIDIWKIVSALKTIFPADGKRVDLSTVIQFFKAWFSTEHIDRGLLVKEWCKGNRVSQIQRTDSGTNAGGGNKTDRNPELVHTLDTLDIDIALATLPMDFNIYDIPGGVFRRAKEIIAKNESPFKEWSVALRKRAGILDYSRAAIFALIRSAEENAHHFPELLSRYINKNLTETDHQHPTEETLAAAGHVPEKSWENEINEKVTAEQKAGVEQPEIANMGNGVFSIDGLMGNQQAPALSVVDQVRQRAVEDKLHHTHTEEATSDVQMEETDNNEIKANPEVSQSETTVLPVKSADATGDASASLNNEPVHHIETDPLNAFYTHLMVDMETMGNGPDAPIVSIGAVFFDPSTGNTGAEFYQVVSLESSMSFGMKPDASTIQWWLKQSSEARSAILVDEAMGLLETLELLADFIAENAANGSHTVQLWGNGCSFDNVILRRAYALTDTPFAVPFRNDRDVRTMVELGKSVGINPRFDIPFEGDMHNALSDARRQVKYVSAIWQRLTAN